MTLRGRHATEAPWRIVRLLRRLRELPLAVHRDLACAVFELAWSRLTLRQADARALLSAPPVLTPAGVGTVSDVRVASECVARVSFAINAVANNLPWRSDCLIRARAAQHWLARRGIPTRLHIGVRKDRSGFEAHAWLLWGEVVVTGGDISGFRPFSI